MKKKIKAKAVLLDIYGTVITSSASSTDRERQDTFRKMRSYLKKTAKKFGLEKALKIASKKAPEKTLYEMMQEGIKEDHCKSERKGIKFPEVKIEKIWAKVLKRLGAKGNTKSLERDGKKVVNFYNSLHKKTRLYPGCKNALLRLRKKNILVGIVSNSQFYTEPMLERLFGKKDFEKVFTGPKALSFKAGFSKPNPKLFEKALKKLKAQKIKPNETIYIGNDLLKDIWGSKNASPTIKAVLFASDCVKWNKNNPKVNKTKADAVIWSWAELKEVVE